MRIQHCLSEQEQRIREQWVLVTLASAFLSILAIYITLPASPDRLVVFLIATGVNCLILCGLIHCAYRKASWRFLTFMVNVKIITLLILPLQAVMPSDPQSSILDLSIGATELFLIFVWLNLSLKLRKLNARAWRKLQHSFAR